MNVFLNSTRVKDGCISSAVSLGDFVYVSGQTGEGDTIEEQTIIVCNKLIDVLSDLDLELRHVVKLTVYLNDLANKEAFLNVYKNFVEAPYPAATIVQVDHLENDAMITVEALAINTLRYEKASRDSGCTHDCDSCSGC